MYNRVKGTQDFLDLTLFNFVVDSVKKHLSLYHFKEISTPIIEHLELFQRSLGLETDVVSKEMYVLMGDDEQKICLRPEATASCVRAFVNNHVSTTPWKVFLWGPMFRHERPQKGRFREFNQVTMEIIGSQSIYQDAHFIKMLDRLFNEVFKLDSYALHLNFLGCQSDRVAYKKVLREFLAEQASVSCALCITRTGKNILRIFDCKNAGCQDIYKKAPPLIDSLCKECVDEWQELCHNLEHLSVSYSYVPTLVRGLDYYDKTVFEFVSLNLGTQNTFCGGGRYNSLVKEIGAKEDQPSVGAALGIERIILLLEGIEDRLALPPRQKVSAIIPMDSAYYSLALLIADELQAHDVAVEIFLEGDSLKSMFRKAHKMGAHYVLLLGEKEQLTKTVTVKHMETGDEKVIPHPQLVDYIKTGIL